MINKISHAFLALVLSFVLLACGSAQKQSVEVEDVTDQNVEELLLLANSASEEKRNSLLLQASGLLVKENRIEKALEVLSYIEVNQLSDLMKDSYYLHYGEILLASEQSERQISSLTQFNKIINPSAHSIKWQVRHGQALSKSYLLNNNYFESAKQRIDLYDLIDDPLVLQENNNQIWQALIQMELPILKAMSSGFNSRRINGWLEVVYLNKLWGNQPTTLIKELEQWKKRYPLHPAQINKPKSLRLVATSEVLTPKQIAVLLPLSGRFATSGKKIQSGLIAAQYQTESIEDMASMHFYDTAKSLSGLTSYKQALDDGADFIIGPLDKKSIAEIINSDVPLVPTLFLNKSRASDELIKDPNNQIYQFGLPVEDEAIQAAHRAFEKGYRKALTFVKNDQLGLRAKSAFKNYFEQLGGELIDSQEYDDIKKLNDEVQEMLRVGDSIKRKNQLEKTLGRNIEYTMRRRKDADVVFLFSNAQNARRIKPFINFYFALDLPVIATSRVFSGTYNIKKENDLNGVEFSDIPLYLSQQEDLISLRNKLTSIDKDLLKQNNGRLFALGFDSYQIISQLPIMKAFPDYHWYGLSGELGVDEFGVLRRYLTWAKFKNGFPEITKERIKPVVKK
ncbi:MAG: penicillin-binding protein activator, partial [Kangiellaceae bacterium]